MANIYNKSYLTLQSMENHDYVKNKYLYDNLIVDCPSYFFLSKYYDYIKINSNYKKFESKYTNRPDYLSYDEYKTTEFWFILMYINNCFSLTDFNFRYIYVPKKIAIDNLLSKEKIKIIRELK